MSGFVYLMGAGPGDVGLLTVRAKAILECASVVVYDRLVSPEILALIPARAQLIDVGKLPQHHKVKQSEINRLLVEYAKAGNEVVRLKGGDPFVFGRGGEEALELAKENIPFEIIPGITSGIAVPALEGIPVSHRGISTAVHLITAHEREDNEPLGLDLNVIAQLKGTLVFYMGVSTMPQIAKKLISFGKDENTPIAFIEKGATPEQHLVSGILKEAETLIAEHKVRAPAITIIGDVVNLHREISWKKKLPLQGKKFVVTRSHKQNSTLVALLKNLGASVIACPLIGTEEVEDNLPLDLLKTATLLVFTSVNGIEHFFNQLKKNAVDFRVLLDKKFATVGALTAKKLREYGFFADLIPDVHDATHLAKLLVQKASDETILLLQGNLASDEIQNLLALNNIKNKTFTIYRTLKAQKIPAWTAEKIAEADGILFASGSAIDAFEELLKVSEISWNKEKPAFVIGNVTHEKAQKLGFKTQISKEKTMESMVQNVLEYFGEKK